MLAALQRMDAGELALWLVGGVYALWLLAVAVTILLPQKRQEKRHEDTGRTDGQRHTHSRR